MFIYIKDMFDLDLKVKAIFTFSTFKMHDL